MSINLGANKIKGVYLGTSKVKEIHIGTEQVYVNAFFDSSRWNTLWTGNAEMNDIENWENTLTINGLNDSKPIKISAECHIAIWIPCSAYDEPEILYTEHIESFEIDTWDADSNVPMYCDAAIPFINQEGEEPAFYSELQAMLYVSGNTVYAEPALASFCGGASCGMAYWVIKEVAQCD